MSDSVWRYSKHALAMKSSVIRETLKLTAKPGVLSFGGGLPAPELFPSEILIEACKKILTERPAEALQYGTTEGYLPLREAIAERMSRFGVNCTPDKILITGGSQQGLHLLGSIFLDEGDWVIAARPTYLGAIQAFNAYGPQFATLPSDNDGMVVEGLEELLKSKSPKMLYLVPTFQNPDGRTIPLKRRVQILELAKKYNTPVIEDDPYSELSFEGTIPKHLFAIEPENVVLLGTFSKLLAPGLRTAWLIAPTAECFDRCVKMKQGADLHTNTFAQHLVYEFLQMGELDNHIQRVKEVYSRRRDVMVKAMREHFPEGVSFTEPTGGLFLWVSLPKKINATELMPKAVEKLVAYIPGSAFYPNGGGENEMRLNFSKANEEEIEIGIKRLGELFKEALKS